MRPPWGIRIRDEAPLSLVALVAGDAWVVLDDGSAPTRLGTGDLAILRGPTTTRWPTTRPRRSRSSATGAGVHHPDGVPVTEAMTLGVRTWGNDPEAR